MFRNLLLVSFLFVTGNAVHAQALLAKVEAPTPPVLTSPASHERSVFYADSDNKLFYIDFEQLNVNLKDIVVRDAAGAELLREEVFGLPVDAIYELDLSAYRTGLYYIELHSFTSVIRKAVRLE